MRRRQLWIVMGLLLAVLAGGVALRPSGAGPGMRTVAAGAFIAVAVDAKTGRAFVASDADNGVRMFDTRNGTLLRTVAIGADPDGIAVDARRGYVFVTNRDTQIPSTGRVSVLDARDGRVLGAVTVGVDPDNLAVDEQTGRVFVTTSQPFARAGADSVDMLDGRGDILLRTTTVTAGLRTLAVDARTGRVLAGSDADGTVSMLDARSLALLHTVVVGQGPAAVVIDARAGHAFVVNNGDSSVSVLETGSATLLRKIAVAQNPTAAAVDEQSGQIFVASLGAMDPDGNLLGTGTLSVVDARSGLVERTIAVGVAPSAVSVDERTGHVFILNAGGTVDVRDAWAWVPPWLRRLLPFLPPAAGTRTMPGSVTMLDLPRT